MSSIIKEDQYFDNEMNFCRITSNEAKTVVENTFLNNGISYFVKWEDRSFLKRIFGGRSGDTYILRINKRDYEKAVDLVDGMRNVEVIGEQPEAVWSPKEEMRMRESGKKDN